MKFCHNVALEVTLCIREEVIEGANWKQNQPPVNLRKKRKEKEEEETKPSTFKTHKKLLGRNIQQSYFHISTLTLKLACIGRILKHG